MIYISGWILIIGLINSLFFQPIDLALQYFSLLPFGIFIIFLSIRLLKNIMILRLYPDHNLLAIPHFWISSTVLFFYLEALFLFGTYQFNPEFVVKNVIVIFTFNKFMAGLMYLLFGISFVFPHLSKNPDNLKSGLVFLSLISNISFIFLIP